jgi:hypothetical protein
MRLRFLFAMACFAVIAPQATAFAEAAETTARPVLREARIDVRPEPQSKIVAVDESFTVDGVGSGTSVTHVLARFPGVEISGLRVMVGSTQVLATTPSEGEHAATIAFTAPREGKLSYTLAYTVQESGHEQVPILVPHYAGDGSRLVRLRYHVPEGYHVQGEPFPVVIGSTGVQQRDLIGVPSFVAYELGRQPSSGWGLFSWMGAIIIVLGLVMSVVVIVREARAARR